MSGGVVTIKEPSLADGKFELAPKVKYVASGYDGFSGAVSLPFRRF